jgi:hypothetical protein
MAIRLPIIGGGTAIPSYCGWSSSARYYWQTPLPHQEGPTTMRFISHFLTLLVAFVAFSPDTRAERSGDEANDGFVNLFDGKTLAGWQGDIEGYQAQDGILVCTKEGRSLRTEKSYGNFVYRFEFRLQAGGNNGIDVRGMEIQILDDDAPKHANLKPCQYHGSVYCHVPAKRGHQKPIGQWNEQEIRVDGDHVTVTLNGVVIVDAKTDHNALKKARGSIGFKGHRQHVEFRNLRIKELP